jgi:hypothetical protein
MVTMAQPPAIQHSPAKEKMKRFPNPLSYLGFFWIGVGCAINEWTISNVFEIDALSSMSRYIIYMWNGASISWGTATILLPHKELVKSTNLLLLTIIFLATTAEYILRSFPTVLGHDFANGVLTKYTTRPDGIYYFDPALTRCSSCSRTTEPRCIIMDIRGFMKLTALGLETR